MKPPCKFHRGQLVQWSKKEAFKTQINKMRTELGDGPFRVSSAKPFKKQLKILQIGSSQVLTLRFDSDLRRVRYQRMEEFADVFFEPCE